MSLLRKLLTPSNTSADGDNRRIAERASAASVPSSVKALASDLHDVIEEAKNHDDAGRYAESFAIIKSALASSPDDSDLLLAKASTLLAWGRYHEAREVALWSELLGPRRSKLCLILGWSSFHLGKLDDAEAWMRSARDISPDLWESHLNLAVVLQSNKLTRDAIASYEKALTLNPGVFDCLIGLGNCFLDLRDAVTAESYFREAIAAQSERPEAWNHLGVALGRQDRVVEAQQAFERCARIVAETGEDVDSFVNLAIHLRDNGRTQEALDLFERNLRQRSSVFGQLCYAHALLRAGRLVDGWNHYEFRWLSEPLLSLRVDYHRPIWTGQDLNGKTILLREEQGFGDTIQFIRYAPHVKALGATVFLRIGGGIESLARGFPGVDRVLGPADPTPEFDFLIHPLSLPRIFGTDLESIPAQIPYLHAKPEIGERWSRRLSGITGLRVGLAWAGSPLHPKDRYRSMSLSTLVPLADVPGVRFISLQKGAPSEEVSKASPGFEIMNLGPELEDFCDTAAVISLLDLVVCVDTAVAHLAGALGKPVWLMVPTAPDFRWMEGRDDTPWYPAMRLFRQERIGVWEDVVARIKAALANRVAQQTPSLAPVANDFAITTAPPFSALPQVAGLSTLTATGFSAVAETRMGILQYLPDEPVVGPSITWYGEYLHPQLLLLTRIVKPGTIVMEVNAGIGVHSLVLAGALGPQGHLFLYEPREIMQPILRENLAANRVTNVTVMKRSLGQPHGPFADGVAVADNATRQNRAATETLDELQLDRLDWLKINDGAIALQVLEGAADSLWRLRPAMFIAAEGDTVLAELKSQILEFSYRCWRMDSALFNPENFNRRDADIFPGQTALALLAIPEEISADIEFDGCVELQ